MISKNKIMEVGLFPLAGQYFNKAIKSVSNRLLWCIVLLFGPRKEIAELTSEELNRLYLRLTIITGLSTFGIAIAAFVGNFKLIANLAFEHGIDYPMAYLIPIVLDSFVMISIGIVLGAALVGQKVKVIKLLVLMSSLTGVYFNVAHVLSGTAEINLMIILLHSILGLFLYLTVEVTAFQITNYIKRRAMLKTNEILRQEIDDLQTRKSNLSDEIEDRIVSESDELRRKELQPILSQVEAAKEELGRLVAQSKKASQTSGFTEDDIKTAFLLGSNPNATGQDVATLLGKNSASIGNVIKRKIKPAINGAMAE